MRQMKKVAAELQKSEPPFHHGRVDREVACLARRIAGIVVARHPETTEDLFDNRSSPRTEGMVAAAVQWAERIMRKIDNVFLGK